MITSQQIMDAALHTQRAEGTLERAQKEAACGRPICLKSMNSQSNFFETVQNLLNDPASPVRDICFREMQMNLQAKREKELALSQQRQKELQGVIDDGQKKIRRYSMTEKLVYEPMSIPDNIADDDIEDYILNHGGSFSAERSIREEL